MNTIVTKPLSAVEVGDQLIITDQFGPSEVVVAEKVSKREIKAGGRRWVTRTGCEVGTSENRWIQRRIQAATPSLLEKVNNDNRYITANRSVWRAMDHIKDLVESMSMIQNIRSDRADKLEAALPHLEAAIEALTSSDQSPTPC